MDRKRIILAISLAVVIFSMAFSFSPDILVKKVSAQERPLEINYPSIGGFKPEKTTTSITEYAKYIFNFAVAFVAIMLLYSLIKGGILYMTSSGDTLALKNAKEQLSSALWGILILLSSYIILITINPRIAVFDLTKLPIVGFPSIPYTSTVSSSDIVLVLDEISIGTQISKGLWSSEETQNAKALVEEIESFLNEASAVTGSPQKISDLEKYLSTLMQSCRCGALTAMCAPPEDFALPIGCSGDPCKDNRVEIDKIVDENRALILKLSDYKKRIDAQFDKFQQLSNTFFENYDALNQCADDGVILTKGQYLGLIEKFNIAGWRIQVMPSDPPPAGDSLIFYCAKGGTILDALKTGQASQLGNPLTLESQVVDASSNITCPAMIPLGEMVDEIVRAEATSNIDIRRTGEQIQGLTEEMSNLAGLISEFNDQNCEIKCTCAEENICYSPPPPLGVCGTFQPLGGCKSISPVCDSPCLQSTGSCVGKNNNMPYYGLPGKIGRPEDPPEIDSVIRSVKNIKAYEDAILELTNSLKVTFAPENRPYLVETPDVNMNLLNNVKSAFEFCSTPDPNSILTTLRCNDALGRIGPNGGVITDCHPNSYFCCTIDSSTADSIRQRVTPLPLYSSGLKIGTYNGTYTGMLRNPGPYVIPPAPGSVSSALELLYSCLKTKIPSIIATSAVQTNHFGNLRNGLCRPMEHVGCALKAAGCAHSCGGGHYGIVCNDGCSHALDLSPNTPTSQCNAARELRICEQETGVPIRAILGGYAAESQCPGYITGYEGHANHIHLSIVETDGTCGCSPNPIDLY